MYLRGNGGVPANALLVQQQAAQLGYHVIGLMYVNSFSLKDLCTSDPDPNSCFENAHFEIVYGVDTSSVVEVNQPNSIVNRLTKLLQYLGTNFDTSGEGWSQFLADGHPSWSQIVVTGLSQGAGNAAMIAKHQLVARVVMFSGVTDALPMGALPCQGADNWLSTHVTPSARYGELAHDQDLLYPNICENWDSLGMTEFGPLVQVETSAPPYGGTKYALHRPEAAERRLQGGSPVHRHRFLHPPLPGQDPGTRRCVAVHDDRTDSTVSETCAGGIPLARRWPNVRSLAARLGIVPGSRQTRK